MNVSVPISIYLKSDQYFAIREMKKKYDRPYSEFLREGCDYVIQKYQSNGGKDGKLKK